VTDGSKVGYAVGDVVGDRVGGSVELVGAEVGAGECCGFSLLFLFVLVESSLLGFGMGGALTLRGLVVLTSIGVSGSIQSALTCIL